MCGITGFYLRDPSFRVNQDALLDALLLGIEDRGKHATGYVAIGDEGTLEWQKASCAASEFIKYRRLIPDGARSVIGHTRWATQGIPAFMENNHPIKRGPFYIIHNGHVHNDGELFKEAARDPFGEVDSEAIAARLSFYGDLKYLGNVIEEIDGDAAVAAVDERNPGRFAVAKGSGSPLYVYNGKRIVLFGSTRLGVEEAYEKHIGRLGKDQLKWSRDGEMFFWNGENEYWKKDLILPRPKYGWQGTWDNDDWEPSTVSYSTTNKAAGKTKEEQEARDERIEAAVTSYINRERLRKFGFGVDDDEYHFDKDGFSLRDEVDCDNCSKTVKWEETFDFWDTDSKYTFQLCPECYEFYNAAEEGMTSLLAIEAGDSGGEVIDLNYDEISEDYCSVNEAVLRQIEREQAAAEGGVVRMIDRLRRII
jgi:Glutamine amidotransferase domain